MRIKVLALVLMVGHLATFAQEKMDTTQLGMIRREGMQRSQLMTVLSMLTDVHGPRLTNSPGYKKAAAYALQTLQQWGLENVHYDTWNKDFGRGWALKKFSLQALEPGYFPLIAHPKAWSPGVKGVIRSEVVYLDVKKEEDIAQYKGKLKGKIVLFSLPTPVKPGFEADASRLTDKELLEMANSVPRESANPAGRRFRATDPQRLAWLKWDLCQKEGVVAVLEASPASRLEDGTLTVSAATVPYPPDAPFETRVSARDGKAPVILPQIVVAAEHYNRMVRQLQHGPVKVELAMEVEFTPVEKGFNVIAEIPGSDLKDEVVMIGAHLDSWHSGTGATDNASGSAVMMEAIRLIKSLGITPRRTIRIGLWGGEEQGLIGSSEYVTKTFGERLDKVAPWDSIQLTPAGKKFSLYLNMDNGTGKYRGVYLQGNKKAHSVFRDWLVPFHEAGAATVTLQNTGGTDHLSFDRIGLPGFQFIQDPIEYGTRTHHTNMDVYDKTLEEDLKHNAIITAAFAWMAANRDELFPRK